MVAIMGGCLFDLIGGEIEKVTVRPHQEGAGVIRRVLRSSDEKRLSSDREYLAVQEQGSSVGDIRGGGWSLGGKQQSAAEC